MDAKLILFAVPIFGLALALEAWVARRRGETLYRAGDTFANLASGLGSQFVAVLTAALVLWPYRWLFDHAALVRWAPHSWWPWVLAFVGVDFFYYWWHRASHRVNLFWATHVVHHQSDEFNLSVALRQSWFGGLTGWPFYLPLALLGVPPALFLAANAFTLVYQFFIHTRLVNRWGILESVLNTPSHHRVHHGSNPRYLDVNYGATLVIWDRWFGTFVAESEPVRYGTVAPFRSFDAFRANFQPLAKLFAAMRVEGVLAPLMPPGWRELATNAHLPVPVSPSASLVRYLAVETFLTIAAGCYWIALGGRMELAVAAVAFLWLLGGLAVSSRWLGGYRDARALAWLRNGVAIAFLGAWMLTGAGSAHAVAMFAFVLVSSLWLATSSRAIAMLAALALVVAVPALAEPPPSGGPPGPKFDAKSLSQLGPEHLQLVYCGAKASLAQAPEHRKRLDAMAKDPSMNQLFDKKGTAETRRMIDKAAAEAKRIVKDAGSAFRQKTKKAIGDGPCLAFAAATRPGANPSLEACNSRYRLQIAEKLDAEVRSPAVASDFRERFRDKLAQDLEQAKKNVAETEAAAKAAEATFDPSGCRFDRGVTYEARRAGP